MMTQIAIRKKIICLLATYLHKKPKLLSQEVEEIKETEVEEVSSNVPINTIVMPIRITFDNPVNFNDHFSKQKDLTISFDSTTTSILPHPLLDSDSPFTAELSASVTLNSLGNEDKVFKPGILVYHAIHDKNLVTLEENLKENISSGTLLVFKEPSFLLPPPEPPDESLKNVVLNFYQSKKMFPLHVEDTFAFIIWTFLPFFTYTKASPMIFSFRKEIREEEELNHLKQIKIMAMVRKGKPRGNILGVGRVLARQGRDAISINKPRGAYTDVDVNELKDDNKWLRKELAMLRTVVRSDNRMSQLLT
ncbi:hypothetical protein Tco_0156482 [Tanacetum coccineum]